MFIGKSDFDISISGNLSMAFMSPRLKQKGVEWPWQSQEPSFLQNIDETQETYKLEALHEQ